MTPVDAIISHFETLAKLCREAAERYEVGSVEEGYTLGKAKGFQDAADFLKGLQKLFN